MPDELIRRLSARRMVAVPPDLGRMRRERHQRLQAAMARQDVDLAVLLHGPNVSYATGHGGRGVDVTHASFERPVAVVVAGADRPHLLADDADPSLDVERHPAVWPELDEGAVALARVLAEIAGPLGPDRRVAVDDLTGAMLRAELFGPPVGVLPSGRSGTAAVSASGGEVSPHAPGAMGGGGAGGQGGLVDAAKLVGAAKVRKTDDEMACIAEAQRRNEAAMVAAETAVRPGARRSEVAGVFLAELSELGTEANMIDPIFQAMARTVAAGPRTTTGDVAFPTGVGDPTFAEGDLVWVDTGVDHRGYVSDFGRTWVVGRGPTTAERDLFVRWCEVMVAVLDVLAPGATGGELCRAATEANGGKPPWLPHFYLAHGVGVESAEAPLLGTDLGPEVDERLVLAPGMVLVLEPVVWEDGVGGYRAEEIVAVTDDGWCHLGSGHPYPPFTGRSGV